jgi:hypothetical protein
MVSTTNLIAKHMKNVEIPPETIRSVAASLEGNIDGMIDGVVSGLATKYGFDKEEANKYLKNLIELKWGRSDNIKMADMTSEETNDTTDSSNAGNVVGSNPVQIQMNNESTDTENTNGPADQEQNNVWTSQRTSNDILGHANANVNDVEEHPITVDQDIQDVIHYIKTSLSEEVLQEFADKCCSVDAMAKGDGSGLGGGFLIDRYTIDFLISHLEHCLECHEGESDLMILKILLSLKKIQGKSTIALDWSKNPEASTRPRFTNHIMIINLKTEQWWKNGPKEPVNTIDYTLNVVKGIYFVDKEFCRQNITLSSNNKTYTLVEPQYLYTMLYRSIQQGWFIELPEIKNKYQAYLAFK